MKKILFIAILVCGILDAIYPLDVGPYTNYCIGLAGAILAGAAISAGTQVIGGAMNAYSQNQANSANAALTREQLEEQKRQFNENMAWNKYQYNDQKVYNSTLAQVQRAREAGINPEFMLHGMNAGNVQTTGMPSPTAQIGGANQQPFDYSFIGNAVSTGLNGYFDMQIKNEQAKQLAIDNFYRAQQHITNIEKTLSDGRLNEAKRKALLEEYEYNKKIRQDSWDSLKKNNQLLDLYREQGEFDVVNAYFDSEMKAIQKDLMAWESEYRKKYGDKQLSQLDAIIRNLDSDSSKKNMEKLESEARKAGINLDNDSKRQLAPLIKKATELQNDKTAAEAENARMSAVYGKNPYEYFTRREARNRYGYPQSSYLERSHR